MPARPATSSMYPSWRAAALPAPSPRAGQRARTPGDGQAAVERREAGVARELERSEERRARHPVRRREPGAVLEIEAGGADAELLQRVGRDARARPRSIRRHRVRARLRATSISAVWLSLDVSMLATMSESGGDVTEPTSRASARRLAAHDTADGRRRARRAAPQLRARVQRGIGDARAGRGAVVDGERAERPDVGRVAALPVREEAEVVLTRVVGDDRRDRLHAARDDRVREGRQRRDRRRCGCARCCGSAARTAAS